MQQAKAEAQNFCLCSLTTKKKILPPPKPSVLQIEDAGEAPPFARPTETAEKQPKAAPLPTDAELPKGEIAVRPQTKPQAQTETKTNELPQPVLPDAPREHQPTQNAPKPPLNPNTIPPIIIGAGALRKLALDKLSAEQKAELTKAGHTLPSLPPDANRLPKGDPKVRTKNDVNTANLQAIARENESAEILAKVGYDIEQLPDSITGKIQRVKKPDYKIEGETFDHYAPTTSNPRSIATTLEGKITDKKTGVMQADRFVLNLDDSNVSLEQMKKQLEDYPLPGLKEIILVKGGEVTLFFPFEK